MNLPKTLIFWDVFNYTWERASLGKKKDSFVLNRHTSLKTTLVSFDLIHLILLYDVAEVFILEFGNIWLKRILNIPGQDWS